MNIEMAYLLGMLYGNGEVRRDNFNTTVSIDIPHKKLVTPDFHDVKLYVKASVSDIKNLLDPLIGSNINFNQNDKSTIISFTKQNTDFLIREIVRLTENKTEHSFMRVHKDVFSWSLAERKKVLQGFADVTGYIRRSNAYFNNYEHRVYLEVPHNWYLVIDICNVLQSVDIPVQTIDWAHPNMRDSKVKKYNEGKKDFWKKEHQIKIWANEFSAIGFAIIHKQQALENYVEELLQGFLLAGKDVNIVTHKYYWEKRLRSKKKPQHPGENHASLPKKIKGKHFDNWAQIADVLGYMKYDF